MRGTQLRTGPLEEFDGGRQAPGRGFVDCEGRASLLASGLVHRIPGVRASPRAESPSRSAGASPSREASIRNRLYSPLISVPPALAGRAGSRAGLPWPGVLEGRDREVPYGPMGFLRGGTGRSLLRGNRRTDAGGKPGCDSRSVPGPYLLRIFPTTSTRTGTPSIASGSSVSGSGGASRLTFTP